MHGLEMLGNWISDPGALVGFPNNPIVSLLMIWVVFNVFYCVLLSIFTSNDLNC